MAGVNTYLVLQTQRLFPGTLLVRCDVHVPPVQLSKLRRSLALS